MNIAIAGYGVEGRASYAYWSGLKDGDTGEPLNHHITIVDENPIQDAPVDAAVITGEDAFSKLNGFDLVIRTAGLAPNKIVTDGEVWSATNEFFAKCPAPIIGVTGTKGKGTTSSLIASILGAAGKNVHLVGNIGVPALHLLSSITKDDIVVFELSSYQLWDIHTSPHIAVVLLIEPDHLHVHYGMEDYVGAKARIASYQKPVDSVIYHPTNAYSASIAAQSAGKQIPYGVAVSESVYVEQGMFMYSGTPVCSVGALQLIGQHNIENACAALTVAKQLAIPDDAIAKGLRQFTGLPHRLEFVREYEGVKYYNDSFSSAPSAAVAAVKSFTAPELLIVGGIDKGADFSELADTLKNAANIKEVFIIGEIREKLNKILKAADVTAPLTVLDAQTMPEIIRIVRSRVAAGDVVVLSPACASFDMFRDFYDRGDQFREVVKALS